MMAKSAESPLARCDAYRAARRAFIAACEKTGADAIARPHPAKSADGKPLFMDAAALGPRRAARAVLVIARGAHGSIVMTELLRDGLAPPDGMRVVLVHALDPAAFAGAKGDPGWAAAKLGAVATEDLSRVRDLGVLPLDAGEDPSPALSVSLAKARISLLPLAATAAEVQTAIAAFLAE
jgi:hypothetical protein